MSQDKIFYSFVGTYVRCINSALQAKFRLEPLANHIKIVGGYAFKSAEYKKSGVPIVRISDFNNERVDISDAVYYTESKELERFSLSAGDVLIALTGGTIGKLGIVQDGLGKLYLNQRVGKFQIVNESELEPEFIYWIARSVQDTIKNLAWGGAQPNVSPKQIEELKFAFPDKKIQRGIIRFLNDLKDDSIDESREYFSKEVEREIIRLHKKQLIVDESLTELSHQLTHLTQLRQALLREVMQGQLLPQDPTDEPAAVLLQQLQAATKPGKKGRGQAAPLFAEEAEVVEGPFAIPASWAWCRLGNVTSVFGGITLGKKYTTDLIEVPYLRVANVQRGFISTAVIKTLKTTPHEAEKYKLAKGDILVNEGGDFDKVGRGAIWDGSVENCIHQNHLFRVVATDISNKWVEYAINSDSSRQHFLGSYVKMTNLASISKTTLVSLPIPLPPLAEQHRIVVKLEQLFRHCDDLEQRIRESRRLAEQLLATALREAMAPPTSTEPTEEAEPELVEAETTSATPRRGRLRKPVLQGGDQMSLDGLFDFD